MDSCHLDTLILGVVCTGRVAAGHLRRAVSSRVVVEAGRLKDAVYHEAHGADKTTAVKWWVRWRRAQGLSPILRAEVTDTLWKKRRVESTICLFASWLRVHRRVDAGTVRAYVGTVMAWHERRFGPMLPLFEPASLRALLKGMRVRQPETGDKRDRRPVLPQLLRMALQKVVDRHSLRDVTMAAAASVAFCGLLRVSEYAAKGRFDARRLPTVADCQFQRGRCGKQGWHEVATLDVWPRKKGLKVSSKSCQVTLRDGAFVQPVAWLKQMRALRKQRGQWRPNDPLFMVSGEALSVESVHRFAKFCMGTVGEDPALYGSHSFRIGGATAAFAAGVDEATVRALGRWDSETSRLYTRMSRQAAMRLGAAVASTAVDPV